MFYGKLRSRSIGKNTINNFPPREYFDWRQARHGGLLTITRRKSSISGVEGGREGGRADSEQRQSSEMIVEFSCLNTDKENLWP